MLAPGVSGLIVAAALVGCGGGALKQAARAPLYENLGGHHHPITTSSTELRRMHCQAAGAPPLDRTCTASLT